MNKIGLFLVVTVALVSCAQGAEEKNDKPAEKKHTVIDVRTASEYQDDHFAAYVVLNIIRIMLRWPLCCH